MSVNCEQFMKSFSDADATDKEKLEYAQCVNDNVYLVSSHNNIYENQPLMFAIIFVTILLIAILINAYVKKTNHKRDQNDKK